MTFPIQQVTKKKKPTQSATRTVQSIEMMETFQTQNGTFRKQNTNSMGTLEQIL